VQVDPMKPMLKPPGTKHLKLKYDVRLSSFAFEFNLRRSSEGAGAGSEQDDDEVSLRWYGSYSEVGWCRLTLSNPL